MAVLVDRVKETSTTTGTGDFTLGGAATGYRTFNSAISNGATVYYVITDGTNWETGIGTFTSPSTLARTTVSASSNGGAAVNWGAGTKDVFCDATASSLNAKLATPTGTGLVGVTSGAADAAATTMGPNHFLSGGKLYGGCVGQRAVFTPPVDANFSWVNQGTSSVRDDTDSIVLIAGAAGSGANFSCRVASLSGNYDLKAAFTTNVISKTWMGAGLCLRDSVGGKIVIMMLSASSGGVVQLRISKFNSATSFSADYAAYGYHTSGGIVWFRIVDDGANRICYISPDGVDWSAIHTVSRTDFVTPDQYGFCVSRENTGTPNVSTTMRLLHWTTS